MTVTQDLAELREAVGTFLVVWQQTCDVIAKLHGAARVPEGESRRSLKARRIDLAIQEMAAVDRLHALVNPAKTKEKT
jgi:hypothetical protein